MGGDVCDEETRGRFKRLERASTEHRTLLKKLDERFIQHIEHIEKMQVQQARSVGGLTQQIKTMNVSREQHANQHEWLAQQIEKAKLGNEFKHQIISKLATAGIIGATGILLSVIWYAINQYIHNGPTQ